MYDRILVPVDGSDGTEAVLDHALDLARRHDATVHACYVVDMQAYRAAPKDTQDELLAELRAEGEDAVGRVRERARDSGLETETTLLEGRPDREIVEYAADAGIDVVAMGTHGRSGRDRLANLGSVTQRVLENVACPVFVVHIGAEA